jgi:transcriptional regulator with XRE-family HTH domain
MTEYDWVRGVKLRIHEARRKNGISLSHMASIMNVSLMAAYKWERLDTQGLPSIGHIVELCRHFGISADWLLFGNEKRNTCPNREVETLRHLQSVAGEEYREALEHAIRTIERENTYPVNKEDIP